MARIEFAALQGFFAWRVPGTDLGAISILHQLLLPPLQASGDADYERAQGTQKQGDAGRTHTRSFQDTRYDGY